jgi:hypothetical protein
VSFDDVVTETEMRRGLAEQNTPNRFSDEAIREIFKSHDNKPMSFKTFCLGMLFYNRYKVYSDVMISVRNKSSIPDDTIDLHTYFALMHDRLVPSFLRKLLDSIVVDVPEDMMVKIAENPKYQLTQLESQMDYKMMNQSQDKRFNYNEKHFIFFIFLL